MKKIIYSAFLFAGVLLSTNDALAATATSADELTYLNSRAVEEKVRDYFADTPVMVEIARCESKFRQYTDSGQPLRGGSGGGMVGVFQFFESIHQNAAK